MSSVDERIKIFNFVRDIPYRIALDSEQDYSCSTKSVMLQKMLASLGIESRLIRCNFYWEESGVPEVILKLFKEEKETHQYLEVKIPETGKWVKVDPTWDSKLATLFEIANWDGLHDTALAVKPVETFSPEESLKIAKEEEAYGPEIVDLFARNREFYIAINEWLEKNRK